MTSGPPSVTVVVVAHGASRGLVGAIDAVRQQDYAGDVHVIVVHDQCGPDLGLGVRDGARRVSVVTNEEVAGFDGARRTGVELATGTLTAFCDDQDRWSRSKLRVQVEALEACPGARLATCGTRERRSGRLGRQRQHVLAATVARWDELPQGGLAVLHPSSILASSAPLRAAAAADHGWPGRAVPAFEAVLEACAADRPVVNVAEPLVLLGGDPPPVGSLGGGGSAHPGVRAR